MFKIIIIIIIDEWYHVINGIVSNCNKLVLIAFDSRIKASFRVLFISRIYINNSPICCLSKLCKELINFDSISNQDGIYLINYNW